MDEFHSRVARVSLAVLGKYGFALAGGSAVQVHGIVTRPSEDIDLFTDQPAPDKFRKAVSEAVAAWRSDGLEVSPDQQLSDTFARFYVSDGRQKMKAELSYDWRSEPPVVLDIGPVLSRDDAVANKVCAAFSRGEARDYIDIHAASTGPYTRTELEALAASHDPGFNLPMFAQALRASARHSDREYMVYELSIDQVRALRSALLSWADDIESR